MINVTKPFLPPLEEFLPHLEAIWQSGILSNGGPYHAKFEVALSEYLDLPHVSLFCNATIGLIIAQQALNLSGEVITTPYSFVATTHALHWMRNKPVFVDIEPDSLCIDPSKIEQAVTPDTSGIVALHCYGNTADTKAIDEIAERHNLRVIYDACHSFGVKDDGGTVLRHGDLSVVSFHATKVLNTLEGGLVVSPNAETKRKIDYLKNFGFADEVTVIGPGINGKMNEVNAAMGLLQLEYFDQVIEQRAQRYQRYRANLDGISGIRSLEPVRQSKSNYTYFPIFVGPEFPLTRDDLYLQLQEKGIYGRRYFYPLISEFDPYRNTASASPSNLPVAMRMAQEVICLPMYPDLSLDDIDTIADVIRGAGRP